MTCADCEAAVLHRHPAPIPRAEDPVYDRAVRLVALAGDFVNRHDLPERDTSLPVLDQPADLVRRWRAGR